MTTLLWFRHDLRLADNLALTAAAKRGKPIVPVFIWAPEEQAPWEPGGASRWWLHQSLAALAASLGKRHSRLIVRRGPTLETLRALVRETGADALFWNRLYEPAFIARDAKIKEAMRTEGLEAESFNAALLHEPWTIKNKSGKPFQVFTPFWRHCMEKSEPPEPVPRPCRIFAPDKWPQSLQLHELELEPKVDWAAGLRAAWQPGEKGAQAQLDRFLISGLAHYPSERNRPDHVGTSRLSPHLHFGEVSPRQLWHRIPKKGPDGRLWRDSQFIAELGWREFSHHLLYHFPHTPSEPLRSEFNDFRWRESANALRAWQKGDTGYPIVDAGMRELWTTGWMHNRVRMIVASFLVKDLLISWRQGAAWFWDTLVDADLAQNTLGWQWTAGCGADAAPFFRIFNPVTQGEKFDPNGVYVRRWRPELRKLSSEWIHQPHKAPTDVLREAGIVPGLTYPKPIVSHITAREVALEAFARLREG